MTDAGTVLTAVCATIDERRWAGLPELLDPRFRCTYVHTGEVFDREQWVCLNAEYPGFDRLVVEDLVATGDRAVARCHVTAIDDGLVQHFEVATFVRCAGGRVVEMTEVWTSVGEQPPEGARPQ